MYTKLYIGSMHVQGMYCIYLKYKVSENPLCIEIFYSKQATTIAEHNILHALKKVYQLSKKVNKDYSRDLEDGIFSTTCVRLCSIKSTLVSVHNDFSDTL